MVIVEGTYGPLGGQGGTERKGLWDTKEAPKSTYQRINPIADPDDIPVLHNKINERLGDF